MMQPGMHPQGMAMQPNPYVMGSNMAKPHGATVHVVTTKHGHGHHGHHGHYHHGKHHKKHKKFKKFKHKKFKLKKLF